MSYIFPFKLYNLQLQSCLKQILKQLYRLHCHSVVGCLLTSLLHFVKVPFPFPISFPLSVLYLSVPLCLPLPVHILLSVSTCHSSLLSLPPAPCVCLPSCCLSA